VAENEGVTPESPTGAEAEGASVQDGNPVAQGGGRSLENLHGEFTRKYSQLSDRFESLQAGIEAISKKLGATGPGPAAQPSSPTPPSPFGAPRATSLSDFSDEHIDSYLQGGTLTPYQRQLLETEKATRAQARFANQIWDQRKQQEDLASEKSRAEQAAFQAFPSLRDSNSEFSQKVKSALVARRQRFGEFPTDVYDVANNVAREMGIGEARAITPGSFVAPGFQERTAPAAPKPRKHELNETDLERIGERLASALPSDRQGDGKMKRRTFNKTRLKERSKMYAENADLYKHTRLGGDE